jgi:hypothetical protein
MDNWAQVFSGISTMAFLAASIAVLFCSRIDRAQGASSTSEQDTLPSIIRISIVWRIAVAAGIAALCGSVVVRGATAPTSSGLATVNVGDRATIIAVVTCLLGLGQNWRSLVSSGHFTSAWAIWLIVAVVAGVGILSWPTNKNTAPLLLSGTLISAGMGLWSVGHQLDIAIEGESGGLWSFLVAFSGLTATIAMIGAANWWAWGTPAGASVGEPNTRDAFVAMLAVWLVGATVLVLYRQAGRFSFVLSLIYAVTLTGIALSVQWKLPFS